MLVTDCQMLELYVSQPIPTLSRNILSVPRSFDTRKIYTSKINDIKIRRLYTIMFQNGMIESSVAKIS